MYDVAIIGAGPAGLSAAINLKLHNKSIVWFGSEDFSDKIKRAPAIINYPGFGRVTGRNLSQYFLAQANDMDLEIIDTYICSVVPVGGCYLVSSGDGEHDVQAKTVLFATGSVLEYSIPGEQEFLGNGVHHCASCDAHMYRDKTLAIYCESKEYEGEVAFLAETAEKIYLYTPYGKPDISLDNVIQIAHPIVKVLGDEHVNAILLSDGSVIDIDGIFFMREVIAPSLIVGGLTMDGPHIDINRLCQTNLPGIFAAGDCTGRPYQIAKAVGEGNIAAHSILEFLSHS